MRVVVVQGEPTRIVAFLSPNSFVNLSDPSVQSYIVKCDDDVFRCCLADLVVLCTSRHRNPPLHPCPPRHRLVDFKRDYKKNNKDNSTRLGYLPYVP